MKNKNSIQKNIIRLWIYGKHPVLTVLKAKKREIYQIYATKSAVQELTEFVKKNNLEKFLSQIKIVDNQFIETKIGLNQVHQGFLIQSSFKNIKNENDLINEIKDEKPTILILDQLTDPHNIGAIIRSAVAFGVNKIIFPENNFTKESSIMIKSSAGMIEFVDLFMVININKFLERLKKFEYWCFGLAGEAKNDISEIKKYENIALIIGSEGKGIRSLVKKNCDMLLKIPINEDVESLNASVACSIALYEINSIKKS